MFDIGNRIRELRKSLNMTSTDLASKMEVNQSFVSGLENNSKKCSMENLFKICDIFNITLSEFFNDSKDSIPVTDNLKELIDNAKNLSPEQLELLIQFLKTLK